MKPDMLFLAHRIPFPPNKGDKIRSFHMLEYLGKRYQVHLGTFVDAEEDWEYVPEVKEYCKSSCIIRLYPLACKIKSLSGLVSGRAMTLPYYASVRMSDWVRQAVQGHEINRILVFSSAMAQFVLGAGFSHCRRIIDFVDVDSDKWRQYAKSRNWPLSWVYRREAKYLLQYERQVAESFDASFFVSAAEAEVFSTLAGFPKDSVDHMNNGVDSDYFSPGYEYANPFPDRQAVLVFVGAMDYWANVEAVNWFAKEIFPAVLDQYPATRFYIVGSRPTESVQRLSAVSGVVVTGAVADVRPYLHHASAVIAPLRIARGIQNKVLEAMAMAKPVVATAQALEGLDAVRGKEVFEANNERDFVQRLGDILESGAPEMGEMARHKVRSEYNWTVSLRRLERLMENREPRSLG